MTHKEFYFWLQGFLANKINLNASDILLIKEKMGKINQTETLNPTHVKVENDDLGKPPKIVM